MLRDLESVYVVYQGKSFSKAADKLFVSQPALSATIKKIESQLQMAIFDRSKTPIQLTEAGEYYISYIEKMLSLQQEMQAYFATLRQEHNGVLNIGSAAFFCAHILPDIIQQFKSDYPGYVVNLLEANASDLTQYLNTNIVELSMDVDNMDSSIYNSVELAEEDIILAVPADYQINERLTKYVISFDEICSRAYRIKDFPAVSMQLFKDEQFLLLKQGNDLYKRGLKMCKNAGFVPQVFMYLDQMLTSYYIAKNGKGIAFIRAGMLDYVDYTEQLCFYKIADQSAVRKIMLNYKKNAELSQVALDFMEFLKVSGIGSGKKQS